MAGQVESLVVGILLVSVMTIGLFSFPNGLYASGNYTMNTTPKDPTGMVLINQTVALTGNMSDAVYATQPSSIDILGSAITIATGGFNALLMIGNSFNLLNNLINSMFVYLGTAFAIDPQILQGISAIIAVTFFFAVLKAILGRET